MHPLKAALEGVNEILPVIGILFGVGMLIEVMTLTGIRGAVVIGALSLPDNADAGRCCHHPAAVRLLTCRFIARRPGVLGVPFALAMLGQNQIIDPLGAVAD